MKATIHMMRQWLSLTFYAAVVFTTSIIQQKVWSFQVASSSNSKIPSSCKSPIYVYSPELKCLTTSIPIPDHRRRWMALDLATSNNDLDGNDDDDDGWDTGNDKIADTASIDVTSETRNRSVMQSSTNQQRTSVKQQQKSDTDRDDLFIPIFTVVSICGFLGAYGYEMIRLYLRGELYLPFLH